MSSDRPRPPSVERLLRAVREGEVIAYDSPAMTDAAAVVSAPSPASASASRSAPSFAAHPPQSVSSVRRKGGGSSAVTAR